MGWGVILNGVAVGDCDQAFTCDEGPSGLGFGEGQFGTDCPPFGGMCDGPLPVTRVGFLNGPPDGLGFPPLRTTDVAYAGRDGSVFGLDTYEPRILTFSVTVTETDCGDCASVRAAVNTILAAWSRACGLGELVLFTDCDPADEACDRAATGPYGFIGRPRAALVSWVSGHNAADLTLRFDATDHRIWILDECGGTDETCVTISPGFPETLAFCIEDEVCGDWCFTTPIGGEPGVGGEVDNCGTLCACLTVTFTGPLSNPTLTNTTTGESVTYNAEIPAGQTVVFDGTDGRAMSGTADVSFRMTGSPTFCAPTGVSELVLTVPVESAGSATICYQPSIGG